MLKIGVIYGGKSTEHDISILTGLHLAKHVTEDYQVHLIYLTHDNRAVVGSRKIDDYITGKAAKARPYHNWRKLDCVVNCCHGGAGEDGTLAAALRMKNLPVTSCDSTSAWLQQSKIATRQILTASGFAQPRFQVLTTNDSKQVTLPLPVVVKPEMQGSSIGITVVHNQAELKTALATAFGLDQRVIVEEYLAEMREVNVAVMRENGKVVTSGLEVVGGEKFFSFAEKYFNADSGFVKKSGRTPDDDFLAKIEKSIKDLAVQAYQLLQASGVVRVDFMVQGEKIFLNEINTVPGFMAYHLWLKAGIPYGVVIDNMVQDALTREQKKRQLVTRFDSEILVKNRQLVVEI
ncbi:MAG: ATP-grasp domain-containing protein [Eubacteriales bacterium]|nr:ATP-grasp domain-containing protein [Eubacteriales bacterium]